MHAGSFLIALTIAFVAAACSPDDAGISTKVRANLTADANVNAAAIDVGVQKSVVTLSGTVDTTGVKERAVFLARGTDGVTDVVDQIAVRQSPGPGYGREMSEHGTIGHDAMGNGTMDNGTRGDGNRMGQGVQPRHQ